MVTRLPSSISNAQDVWLIDEPKFTYQKLYSDLLI